MVSQFLGWNLNPEGKTSNHTCCPQPTIYASPAQQQNFQQRLKQHLQCFRAHSSHEEHFHPSHSGPTSLVLEDSSTVHQGPFFRHLHLVLLWHLLLRTPFGLIFGVLCFRIFILGFSGKLSGFLPPVLSELVSHRLQVNPMMPNLEEGVPSPSIVYDTIISAASAPYPLGLISHQKATLWQQQELKIEMEGSQNWPH